MRQQAQSFGAEFLLAEVTGLSLDDTSKPSRPTGVISPASAFSGPPGPTPAWWASRRGGIPGPGRGLLRHLRRRIFHRREVFVVGGGFAAAEEAVFLTKYARHVTILIRGEDFSCAPTAPSGPEPPQDHRPPPHPGPGRGGGRRPAPPPLSEHRDRPGHRISAPRRGDVRSLRLCRLPARHGTAARGGEPGRPGLRPHRPGAEDLRHGLYAAGDVCQKPLRQVVTAVGDGALAATELEKYAAACQQAPACAPQAPPDGIPAGAQHSQGKAERWSLPPGDAAQLHTSSAA